MTGGSNWDCAAHYKLRYSSVETWWHTVTHGRGSEEKTGEWSGYPVLFTLARNMTTADGQTSASSSRLNWRPPSDLNWLVRFAERRNLVSAHVPSHFKRSLFSNAVSAETMLIIGEWKRGSHLVLTEKPVGYCGGVLSENPSIAHITIFIVVYESYTLLSYWKRLNCRG